MSESKSIPLADKLEERQPECPFDQPDCDLEPHEPCPVCGDFGDDSGDDGPSNCGTTVPLRREAAALLRQLTEALEEIARQGGNLPDERLTSKTGPNDAVARGIMYVNSREIARAALQSAYEDKS